MRTYKLTIAYDGTGFRGWQRQPDTDRTIQGILERVVSHLPSDNTVAGRYMCQGKMPMTVRKRYEAMLEQSPEDKRMKAMIDNFDRALSHPDSADLEKLRSMLSAL